MSNSRTIQERVDLFSRNSFIFTKYCRKGKIVLLTLILVFMNSSAFGQDPVKKSGVETSSEEVRIIIQIDSEAEKGKKKTLFRDGKAFENDFEFSEVNAVINNNYNKITAQNILKSLNDKNIKTSYEKVFDDVVETSSEEVRIIIQIDSEAEKGNW